MKRKTLDTNVLLDRPLGDVLASFTEPTYVIIPLIVVEELDRFKKGNEQVNEFGRATSRFLDKLREKGKLNEGVQYENHIVQVLVTKNDLDLSKPDHQIIKCAIDNGSELISQDINVRIVADALGVPVSNFAPEDVNVQKLYSGVKEIKITDEEVKALKLYTPHDRNGEESIDPAGRRLVHNQFLLMKDSFGVEHEGIYDGRQKLIKNINQTLKPWNISPKKNKEGDVISEQRFLLNLLMDKSVEFVSAIGPSGCGKTFLTLAAALEQVLGKEGIYKKIVVMRPLVPIGNDIGYLPGSKLEKLEPWMASTFDALEYLLEDYEMKDQGFMPMSCREKIEALINEGLLELEAMAHIRGRSIPNQFIIIDDAQNLTQHQAASIITRAGEGSKIVFLGDISSKQIDDHRLTPSSNGLAYVADRFKGEDIVGHITLQTVVRSKLAQLGVEKL